MDHKNSTRILRMKDLPRKVGFQPSTLYELIAAGRFPRPFKLVPGGRASGWLESAVDAWVDARASGKKEDRAEAISVVSTAQQLCIGENAAYGPAAEKYQQDNGGHPRRSSQQTAKQTLKEIAVEPSHPPSGIADQQRAPP